MKLRCVVACYDVDGPNLYYVKVECTPPQYGKKQHYEAAEGFISENYEVKGPFWVCDETNACGMELVQRHEWDWDETYVGEEHIEIGVGVKATQQQYLTCVEIYNASGVSGVLDYAAKNGIDSRSLCDSCDADTPDTDDNCCLVCGSFKEKE